MSDHSNETAAFDIVVRIQTEADEKAHTLLEAARQEAESERMRTEEEAAIVQETILEEAKQAAARHTTRTLASARVEASRILLKAREEAINSLFKRIEDRVRDIPNDMDEYRFALTNLLVEAITAIHTERVVVYLGNADRELANDILIEHVKRRVHENTHLPVTVSLHYAEHGYAPGCMAASEDGHIRLDNTLERRIVEARQRLRPQLVDRMEKNLG